MPPYAETKDLSLKTDLEIEKVPAAELAERDPNVPGYKERCSYSEDQIKRLKDELFKAYTRLQDERKSEKLDEKWDGLEAQYAGEMADDTGLEFNLSVPVTQVKCDTVERLALKAFLESDPKFTVTPRPQTARMDKWDVIVNRQADYLDYKFDETIDVESPLRKILHNSVLLGVGIMKIPYEYLRKRRRREEQYSAKIDVDPATRQPRQPGLEAFLRQYPDAVNPGSEGHWVIKDLLAGKDVVFKANFNDLVYDDPNPSFVNIRDFFVSKNCEGYVGLCDEKLTIERQSYTWWELKKAEANGDFENIEACKSIVNDETTPGDPRGDGDYKTRPYEVIECVYHFNEKEGSEDIADEVRLIVWLEVKSKTYLGAIYYPYDLVDCYYIPFYVKNKKAGFYKGGIGEDLTQSNLAQNALLNFMLTEAWQQLMTTPIIRKGSTIADQFLNKRWKPGVPLEVPTSTMAFDQELQFLDKPQRLVAQQMMPILAFLGKYDADRTGITDLASTGANDPTDPTAPAAKTAMLLKASGINISDYINCLLPSFNRIGEIVLGLTYQMTQKGSGRPYRQRELQSKVVGGNPFGEITRDDMIAKTNIQSRAAGFDFDKVNEKRENLALFQVLRMDPILNQNPEGVYTLARTLVQSWSPMWKNKIDQLLPDPGTFQMNQLKVAIQALQVYLQQIVQQAKVTGVAPAPDMKQFVGLAAQMMQQAVNPLPKEAQK